MAGLPGCGGIECLPETTPLEVPNPRISSWIGLAGLAMRGALSGKIGSAFVSTATQQGG